MLEEGRKRSENRNEGCISGVEKENRHQGSASESGLFYVWEYTVDMASQTIIKYDISHSHTRYLVP